MKIAVLTSVHRVRDVRIFEKEAIDLAGAGHDVVIVGWREVPEDAGDVVSSRGRHVRVRRVEPPRSRIDRMLRVVLRVYRAGRREDADVYHIHDPELLPVGALLALQGRNVIFDAHENLSSSVLTKKWVPRAARRLLSWAIRHGEGLLTAPLTAVVAATPAIARVVRNRNVVLVQNFPMADEMVRPGITTYRDRPASVAYVGGFSALRGAREMVEAIGLTAASQPVEFLLAGTTREKTLLEELKSFDGWTSTRYLGWQSREQVAELLGEVRAGMVLFQPAPNHVEAQPNKMFEYMSAGLPVIASDFPLWREIVQGAQCGLLVDPEDPRAIADALRWILSHPDEAEQMGQRGRAAVLSRFNWSVESAKLLDLYKLLASTSAQAAARNHRCDALKAKA